MPLPILFQDQDLIVINKPPGLLVHRTQLDRYETQFAMLILRDQIGAHVYPVHRLDKPTSGALVFALSSEMARLLSLEFSEQRVLKKYMAIVRGIPVEEQTIDYPLKEDHDNILDKSNRKKAKADKPAQEAVTYIRRLSSIELPIQVDRYPTTQYSLIEAQPKTGRRHQIRRHLKHINNPIIGDTTHGSSKHNRFFEERFKMKRLYLASTEISFIHPKTQEQLVIEAPLCQHFQTVITELGLTS